MIYKFSAGLITFLILLLRFIDSTSFSHALKRFIYFHYFSQLTHHSFSLLVQWKLSLCHLYPLLAFYIVSQNIYTFLKLGSLQNKGPSMPLPKSLTCLESKLCWLVVVAFKQRAQLLNNGKGFLTKYLIVCNLIFPFPHQNKGAHNKFLCYVDVRCLGLGSQ